MQRERPTFDRCRIGLRLGPGGGRRRVGKVSHSSIASWAQQVSRPSGHELSTNEAALVIPLDTQTENMDININNPSRPGGNRLLGGRVRGPCGNRRRGRAKGSEGKFGMWAGCSFVARRAAGGGWRAADGQQVVAAH